MMAKMGSEENGKRVEWEVTRKESEENDLYRNSLTFMNIFYYEIQRVYFRPG